jgi:uncharacterized protein YdaU (DUF1376 family)
MAELPYLPIKPQSILADTMHLSAEEFGVYCRLLFVMWLQRGRLSDDDTELARISGISLRRWRQIKDRIMKPMTVAGGQVSQKRLTDTWLKVQENRQKKATAALTRWNGKFNPKH